jgi:hypothetical protein
VPKALHAVRFDLNFLQASICLFLGVSVVRELRRISSGQDIDCFLSLGAYEVCDATQILSVGSNLIFLMAHAMISRALAPGKSNFVTASVRRTLLSCLCLNHSKSHAPKILQFNAAAVLQRPVTDPEGQSHSNGQLELDILK